MVSELVVGLKFPLVLAGDERHDLMDKKNDHSSKHGQRDTFIDACAANYCHAFHSFPLPGDSVRRAVTQHCFGEWSVNFARGLGTTIIEPFGWRC
jgi:hypothetical protein